MNYEDGRTLKQTFIDFFIPNIITNHPVRVIQTGEKKSRIQGNAWSGSFSSY
jgi:hypothetical protein